MFEEPEIVDFVGVVVAPGMDEGKYNAYRIYVADGQISLVELKYGRDRLKKAAIRVAGLDLVSISQGITRGDIEFIADFK